MKLTESQKRRLRGLAHPLKPCIHVGTGGVSTAVITALSGALNHHELLKVKIHAGDREKRAAAVAALLEKSGALLVSRIGNVVVLYRSNPDAPRLALPPAGRRITG